MPDSEAKKQWMKENSRIISFKVMLRTESDIIDFLKDKPTATTIKAAIREYMNNHPENGEE